MKTLVAAAALTLVSSMAMAHGRHHHRTHRTETGANSICQATFNDAQTAKATCAANGLAWVRLDGRAQGYRCGCGSWDPSAPGTAR